MKLLVTIDVEEEGLFTNRYSSGQTSVNNVHYLTLLDDLFQELAIHPTLLITYQVAQHQSCRDFLEDRRVKWGAEIGAHLHPWNTPPSIDLPYPEPVPSEQIPTECLKAKFLTLYEAISQWSGPPGSFRMGRFNLGPRMFSVLQPVPIRVDSSIAPMRQYYGGPAHLSAPVEPYFPDPAEPTKPGRSTILEVPLTILPIWPKLNAHLARIERGKVFPSHWVCWLAKYLLSLSVQPMAVGLARLKTGVRLHRRRSGRVLTIFFHSSELMPGGCPQHPTMAHVERFIGKLARFLSWLRREMSMDSLTLSELAAIERQSPSRPSAPGDGSSL